MMLLVVLDSPVVSKSRTTKIHWFSAGPSCGRPAECSLTLFGASALFLGGVSTSSWYFGPVLVGVSDERDKADDHGPLCHICHRIVSFVWLVVDWCCWCGLDAFV